MYIARHGAFEKGKDVITRGSDGVLRAYQMKGGDIKQKDWSELHRQVYALVELPVVHPSVNTVENHRPFLVTNGRLQDEAIDYINTNNIGWQQRSFPYPLSVIQKDELVSRFIQVHGTFLPKEASDFQRLLKFVLSAGEGPLDKPAFAEVIENIVLPEGSRNDRDVSRSLAALILVASYALSSAERSANHWRVFEGWTMVSSYIRGVAIKFDLSRNYWETSLDLSEAAALSALDRLAQECLSRDSFAEGDWLVDGYAYRSRQMMLAGLLSVWCIDQRLEGKPVDSRVQTLLRKRLAEGTIWGESAAPYMLAIALELEQESAALLGEGLIVDYLKVLSAANADGARGIPDPFASIEDSIGFMHQISDALLRDYSGFSYTMESAIQFLARRLRRTSLKAIWRGFTRVSLDQSIPQEAWEWFRWSADSAVRFSSFLAEPQSWDALCAKANESKNVELPELLGTSHSALLRFLLVYPHRLTPATLGLLEKRMYG